MDLEHLELESLSSLKENLGYRLIIDRIQAEIDNTQADLLDYEQLVSKEKVLYWRALYKILYILKTIPEEMTKELTKLREDIQYSFTNEQLDKLPPEYLDNLMKQYEKKKKKLNRI